MLDVQAVARLVFNPTIIKGCGLAGDDVTREAEQRLGAALERIADMAHEGLSLAAARPPAPEPVPEPAGAPGTTELVARLDSLIDRLRDALAS